MNHSRNQTTRTFTRLLSLVSIGMIGLAVIPYTLQAQEFDCEVSVNDRQISGSSYDYISELGPAIERYINENRWTDDRYENHERIRCRMQIVLTDVDNQFNYTAEVVINMRRPVYNTMQETASVILSDNNWVFHYPRGRSLIYDELMFDDLTSFIDFYIYIMLGFDYDSFSELGGSRHFSKALDILELGQANNAQGWGRSIGSQRNRYGLISDLNNPGYEDLRRSYYQYHRLGLDQFTINQESARDVVLEAIDRISENKRRASRNYLFDIFFDTKYNEIVSLFQNASTQRRLQAYNLLRDADPGHSSTYERLSQ
jgi:hypothetical protein